MKNYTVYYENGSSKTGSLSFCALKNSDKGSRVTKYEIKDKLDYKKISYIDISINDIGINSGDDGFYIINNGFDEKYKNRDYAIGYFKNREDATYELNALKMPVYGLKFNNTAILEIVTGMRENSGQIIAIKDNMYYFAIRIYINGETPYENIEVLEYTLPDAFAGYSDIAVEYREYQLKHGFVSIKDRLNEDLKYSTESINVRIRMAWKPVPCKVLEQTPENEPDVHVACTFDDVLTIMDEYHNSGIEKAEFCLVGWNMKGHDGRWPQILPVEESIGGIDGLKKVIEAAKLYGYKMTCHTNSTDAYKIAENFSENDIAVDKKGELSYFAEQWSGGRSYNVCPKRAYEISMQTLPEVAKLGFKGLHYIDVITCTPPRECFNPEHIVNKKQAGEYFDRLFADVKKMFGAVGSEGSFDYSLKNCDSVLYTSFADYKKREQMHPLAEKYIPFWQIVYHGIVLSNPYARTINSPKSPDKEDFIKCIEYGGRPHIYYYAKFVDDGSDWIGDGDYRVDNIESIRTDANGIKELENEYKKISYLQYEFITRHSEISNNVFETEYSDGTVIICNYNNFSYEIKSK